MRVLHVVVSVAALAAAGGPADGQDARDSSSTQTDRATNTPAASTTPETTQSVLSRMARIDTSAAAFRRLDTDHDGRISALEANANPKVAAAFLEGDKNKDGFLSPEEFRSLTRAATAPAAR